MLLAHKHLFVGARIRVFLHRIFKYLSVLLKWVYWAASEMSA
jgi:hypothetical protein